MWHNVGFIAKIEGVSRQTVGRWIREGRYKRTKLTKGGHYRIWTDEEPIVFLYARVSTSKQKESINHQLTLLKKEYPYGKQISDIASGFNFERKGFKTILERSLSGTACILVATTQDRITRTGFGLIKRLIELSGGEIRLLEETVPSENFDTKSLISFITSFVNSYYGKRSANRKINITNNNQKGKNLSKK